jgi:hypothetical protein
MTTSAHDHEHAQLWQRQPEESPKAYAAFRVFLELGERRTVVGAARQLGKAESLIRGWAARYDWCRRAWQWDQHEQQADARTLREERDEQLRQSLRHADQLTRLSMGRLAKCVHRDPATGELTLDDSVTPYVAVQIYRLVLDIRRESYEILAASAGDDSNESAASEVGRMSDDELRALMELAKQRAYAGQEPKQKENEKENEEEEVQPNDNQ